MATLFLIHGFIGSGKTTFAKKLAERENAVRFSPDEWMAHFYGNNPPQEFFADYDRRNKDMIWSMAAEFLKRGQNVILDYGFWQRALKRTAEMPEGELFIDENALRMFWTKFEPVEENEGAIYPPPSLRGA